MTPTSSESHHLHNQRLIGFNAIIGPEKDGSASTIRRIAPIFDTVGCETALIHFSTVTYPTMTFSLVTEDFHTTGNLLINVQKPWDSSGDFNRENCAFSLASSDSTFTLTTVTD